MGSGGGRTRSGPAPDPNALRRDKKSDGEWTTLPAGGRVGAQPPWPLPDESGRELELWAVYWAKPQAILWEANGQQHEVALHVRRLAEAEMHGAAVSLVNLVRQQMDALLLTIPAMHAARVKIAELEAAPAAKPASRTAPGPGRVSARDRLKALNAGAA